MRLGADDFPCHGASGADNETGFVVQRHARSDLRGFFEDGRIGGGFREGSLGGKRFRGFSDPDFRQGEDKTAQILIRLHRTDLFDCFLGFTDVGDFFDDNGFVQTKLHGGESRFRIIPDENPIFAGLQNPGSLPFMIGGQQAQGEGQGKDLFFSRGQ